LNIKIPFIAVQATDDPVRNLETSNTMAALISLQIAVKEALPYAEFRKNPNTIMITTSLGGHLCWFEMGGTRWHPKPVSFIERLHSHHVSNRKGLGL
jgi:predicted alpha/beta-fold hydrolase